MWEKYGNVKIRTGNGLFEVDYLLKKYRDSDDSPYSIRLEKHGYECENEISESKPIFISFEEATRFLDLLIQNKVTPTSMQDIIDDMFEGVK